MLSHDLMFGVEARWRLNVFEQTLMQNKGQNSVGISIFIKFRRLFKNRAHYLSLHMKTYSLYL